MPLDWSVLWRIVRGIMRHRITLILRRWVSLVSCGAVSAAVVTVLEHMLMPQAAYITETLSSVPFWGLVACLWLVLPTCSFLVAPRRLAALAGYPHFWRYPPTWLAVAFAAGFYYALAPYRGLAVGGREASSLASACVYGVCAPILLGWFVALLTHRRRTSPRTTGRKPAVDIETIAEQQNIEELLNWIADDTPITHPEQDRFKHQVIARRIARWLQLPSNGSDVGSIALVGAYGSGKSSILNLANYYLEIGTTPHGGGNAGADATSGEEARIRLCRISSWGFTDPEAGFRHILTRVLSVLKQEVDCLALAGVPDALVSTLTAAGGWWGAVSRIIVRGDDPDHMLQRISDVLAAVDLRIVICIEDLERNPMRSFNFEHCAALLDHFQRARGLSFVLTTTTADSPGQVQTQDVHLAKLCRFDEGIPVLDPALTYRLLHAFRDYALGADFINPAAPGTWPDPRHLTFAIGFGRSDIEAMSCAIQTPRTLKSVLRETWDTWGQLCGEIRFDDVLYAQIVRTAMPKVWDFCLLNSAELRKQKHRTSERDQSDADQQLASEFGDAVRKAGVDRWIAEELLDKLFPNVPHEHSYHHIERDRALQSISSESSIDYFQRLLAREVSPNELRDQDVLASIRAWRQHVKPDDLPARYVESNDLRFRIQYFAGQIGPSDIVRFAKDTFAHLRACRYGREQDTDVAVAVSALFQACPPDDQNEFLRWWESEAREAIRRSLRFAWTVLHDLGARVHTFTAVEARASVWSTALNSLRTTIDGKPEEFVRILDPGHEHILATFVAHENPAGTPFSTLGEWAYLGETLLQGLSATPRGPEYRLLYEALVWLVAKRVRQRLTSEQDTGQRTIAHDFELDGPLFEKVFLRPDKFWDVLLEWDPATMRKPDGRRFGTWLHEEAKRRINEKATATEP